ncbi:MCP four helix bundle domain-containing protein, partial [Campylobacter jejuni]|nr:MCP four helix bundle domain-containing protein [Campylobacter jejuni]
VANTELKQMYDHRLVGLSQVGQVTQLITTNQLAVAKAVNLEDSGQRNAALESVDANIAVISKILDSYRQLPMTAGEQALYEQFT